MNASYDITLEVAPYMENRQGFLVEVVGAFVTISTTDKTLLNDLMNAIGQVSDDWTINES